MVFAAKIAKIFNARDIHPAFAKPMLCAVLFLLFGFIHYFFGSKTFSITFSKRRIF